MSESPQEAESTPRAGPEAWKPSRQQDGAQQQLALANALLLSLHTLGQAEQFILRETVVAEVLVKDRLAAPAQHDAALLAGLAGWLQDRVDAAAHCAGLGGSSRRPLEQSRRRRRRPLAGLYLAARLRAPPARLRVTVPSASRHSGRGPGDNGGAAERVRARDPELVPHSLFSVSSPLDTERAQIRS